MRRSPALLLAAALACPPAFAQEPAKRTVNSESGKVTVETIASGLRHPWALEFLPDGRMLVTERPGALRIVSKDGRISQPVKNTPKVFSERQGGLLDVALSPNFAKDREVFLTFAEPGPGGTAGTALARGRLSQAADALEDVRVIFAQEPKVTGGAHFGSRIVFARDGKIFVGLGERFKFSPAQDLSNHLGTVVRINRDGSAPQDNPFIGKPNAKPEIWSYGHRNIEGAALHPQTGALWIHEMGPRGGDEVNIPQAGRNYGWPIVSWGDHYDGRNIPDPPTHPEFAASIYHWTPSIAPSGMDFYTAELFPSWRGSLLLGALVDQSLVRLTLDGEKVTGEERIPLGARIRDVKVGPDGGVYVLTDEDDGKLLRLSPAQNG